MKTDWKAFINDKTRMLLTLVALLTGTSYMGAVHRYLELTSHFRLQYLAASALLLSVLLLFVIGVGASSLRPARFSTRSLCFHGT